MSFSSYTQEINNALFQEYLITGIVVPKRFPKPKSGWDSSEMNRWKQKCNILAGKQYFDEIKHTKRKVYNLENRLTINTRQRTYNKSPSRISYQKKYRETHKEEIRKTKQQEKHKRRKQERHRLRMSTDENYRLSHNLRTRVRLAFKTCGLTKPSKTTQMLGCTMPQFREYIQNKLVDGMTFGNYGKIWHLDHIIPLQSASRKFTSKEEISRELIRLNHYTNFQPLFAEDNLRKGSNENYFPPEVN